MEIGLYRTGILGLVIAAFIVIFARETDPFLERIRFLKDDISRRESEKSQKERKKRKIKSGIIEEPDIF